MILCGHKWVVLEKEILPSLLEQLSEAGALEFSASIRMGEKPCIVTYGCTKCGTQKVKRI